MGEPAKSSIIVKHKFLPRELDPRTETLIIGTFNPDAPSNAANFFYSRSRNYLWKLLPIAFGEPNLRKATREEKESFLRSRRIDFVDLIFAVEVEQGQECNYRDEYIDNRQIWWTDVVAEIRKLEHLKRACFTRSTLTGIPNMKKQIEVIAKHLETINVTFHRLKSPARFYSSQKQDTWNKFLHS